MADFHLECFQNEYIPEGRDRMNVVVSVTASGTADLAARPLSDVALQISTPNEVGVEVLKQMEPPLDLTERRQEGTDSGQSYPLGHWGDRARDFFLTLRMPAHEIGTRMDVAQLASMVDSESVGERTVWATWTDEPDDPGGGSRVREPRRPSPTTEPGVVASPGPLSAQPKWARSKYPIPPAVWQWS